LPNQEIPEGLNLRSVHSILPCKALAATVF